jgi:hypothetical protein
MSNLRLTISMSLDGFVAGPQQSTENPLGIGGLRLHEWIFPLAAWRALNGFEGGEAGGSNAVVAAALTNIGATVMGRNMFGRRAARPTARTWHSAGARAPCGSI